MSDALSYLVAETAKATDALLTTLEEISDSLKRINLEALAEEREDLVTEIHGMVTNLQVPLSIVSLTLTVAAAMCEATQEVDDEA